MRKSSLLYFCAFVLISSTVFYSCAKKSNTINDGQVIETPFTLYFTDAAGTLYNTNDGKTTKVIFTSDGSSDRAIVTDANNIIWCRNDLYFSINSGLTFNQSYKTPSLAYEGFLDVNGKAKTLNQSMLINIPNWSQSYVASRDPSGANYFGIAGTVAGGATGSWIQQNYYDTDEVHDAGTQDYMTSFTSTVGDTLYAWSAITQSMMFRPSATDRWKKTYPAVFPFPLDSFQAWYSLGHIYRRLILIDNKGTAAGFGGSPAIYSDDKGYTWQPYSGLPTNTPLMCVCSPFEQLCLVGTDGKGLYLLNPNTNSFQSNNVGLPGGLTVRNISFKENIFKNGNHVQYVFLATNKGLYQSADMGVNWVKIQDGDFYLCY